MHRSAKAPIYWSSAVTLHDTAKTAVHAAQVYTMLTATELKLLADSLMLGGLASFAAACVLLQGGDDE